jgi:hypothetical protein
MSWHFWNGFNCYFYEHGNSKNAGNFLTSCLGGGLQVGRKRNSDSTPDRGSRFFHLHSVQTSPKTHSASYIISTVGNFSGVMRPDHKTYTDLHLKPKQRMGGVIPSLLCLCTVVIKSLRTWTALQYLSDCEGENCSEVFTLINQSFPWHGYDT